MKPCTNKEQLIRQFLRDRRANGTMLLALLVVPFFAILAFVIDFNVATSVRAEAQMSLDSALLAAARTRFDGGTVADMETELNEYFDGLLATNLPGLVCAAPVLEAPTGSVVMTATVGCRSNTILADFMGRDNIDYNLESEVTFGIDRLDVAFVFDLSGSMNEPASNAPDETASRLDALKSAAGSAVSQLLASNGAGRDDVRIAMVGYTSAVNAGPYFEAVTGIPATRTYNENGDIVDETEGTGTGTGPIDRTGGLNWGTQTPHIRFVLYNTETDQVVAELRDGGEYRITQDERNHMNVVAAIRTSSFAYGNDQSMYLVLNNGQRTQTENVPPYALFGDNNGNLNDGYIGFGWNEVEAHVYTGDNRSGYYYGFIEVDFKLVDAQAEEENLYTVTNTCTYERNTLEYDEDTAPRAGQYLSARHATYSASNDRWTNPPGCNSAPPVPLTANATTLNNYVSGLTANGATAGHLGVAWGRYLISPDWDAVWPEGSDAREWENENTVKVLILMTDGVFNSQFHSGRGSSFNQARDHCDAAKAQGVLIYSVAFNAPTGGQAILDYCSSGQDFYFSATNTTQLIEAYDAIALSIADLYVSD